MANDKKQSTSKKKGIRITFEFPEFALPGDQCAQLTKWFKEHHADVTKHMQSTVLAQIKQDLNYDLGPFAVPKKNCL